LTIVTESSHRLQHLLAAIEQRLRERPEGGVLDPETVLALDIVHHALLFNDTADGLALWREALWGRRLAAAARDAVQHMLESMFAARDRGETDAAARICNCLQVVMEESKELEHGGSRGRETD
jgi:hypothetical protein